MSLTSIQEHGQTVDQEENELVMLDLNRAASAEPLFARETLFERLQRCGNARDSTPLPWAQLSVVMMVSLSEGSSPFCLNRFPPLLLRLCLSNCCCLSHF